MGDPQNSEFVTRTNHTACIPCVYYYCYYYYCLFLLLCDCLLIPSRFALFIDRKTGLTYVMLFWKVLKKKTSQIRYYISFVKVINWWFLIGNLTSFIASFTVLLVLPSLITWLNKNCTTKSSSNYSKKHANMLRYLV